MINTAFLSIVWSFLGQHSALSGDEYHGTKSFGVYIGVLIHDSDGIQVPCHEY